MFGSFYRKGERSDIQYAPLVSSKNALEPVQWKWHSIAVKFWITSLVFGLLLYFIDYFELKSLAQKSLNIFKEELPELPNVLKGYLINTPGCCIPDMDPFDSSVQKFIETPTIAKCNNGTPPLFESNLTSIYIIASVLPLYYINNITQLNCCFEEFKRRNPPGNSADNKIVYSKICTDINNNVTHIDSEFIKVACKSNGTQIYEDYFAFVPAKDKHKTLQSTTLTPNILILGLDAVSRVNLHRQLPKTHTFLTKELKAFELLGYNKVADNTFPNLMPVLTGMFEKELQTNCWPHSDSRFDNCSFVWKNFSANNYVTVVGEDCSAIGTFDYIKNGFFKQTSDYYYTSFNKEIENNIGSNKDFNCNQCVGGRHTYSLLLDYVDKFAMRMKLESTPYFGFFWGNSLSHDYLNRPALGDETYYNLFKKLKENGHLDNTVLIFMSDHGIRWGSIRQTYQGQMEERLPFVIMSLPVWFKDSCPEAVMNLQTNVRRLTTPFDLHETLKDLVDVSKLSNFVRNINNETVIRSYSLFSKIPKNRTCTDAEIVSHWCTCQQSIGVDVNDTEVVSAAAFAVDFINSQLQGYAQCAILVLDDIVNARILTHDKEHITDAKSIKDYTLTLQTKPGGGIFEVTVRMKENDAELENISNKWKNFNIIGTISRLNLYGHQSYCITDFHLKLYCYCEIY